MTIFTWTIANLERTKADGGVVVAHYRVDATDDVSGESAEVQAIAAAVHTDEIKAAYQEHLDAQVGGA